MFQKCRSTSTKHKSCNLNCHEGTCKIIPGQGPKCVCPPQFNGPRCEHYRCSQYCKNHGICYIVDTPSSKQSDTPPPLRCNCPIHWTGDRCEKPADVCANRCYNDANCTSWGVLPQCQCKPGFTGLRCQNCDNLSCENGGVCNIIDNKEHCSCPSAFKGQRCEMFICGKYGKPMLSEDGWKCECPAGFTGEKCDKRICDLQCLNGGTCKIGNKQMECICPKNFEGRRCEKSTCNITCKNNGKCLMINMRAVCKCPDEWAGHYCEVSAH